MKDIVKILFGSHLYGTDLPSSDHDYKGVALPTWNQVALGKIPKHKENYSTGKSHSKNTSNDVDIEIYSLHEFIKLALDGQTVAIDMLHAPEDKLIYYDSIWAEISHNRDKFYSKQINSFLGYAIGQAAKYGIKGSRLNAAKEVLVWLNNHDPELKLGDCFSSTFPLGEHVIFIPSIKPNVPNQVEVCGKKLQATAKVGYCIDVIKNFYIAYGERARQAANDQGIDWKAISHAFRAAYQMRELFSKGTITFPRPESIFLKDIKIGRKKYVNMAPMLEDLVDEVKSLKDSSDFPEKPDHSFWEKFIIDTIQEHLVPRR